MNSYETKNCKLKDKERFSYNSDLLIPGIVIGAIWYIFLNLKDIVSSLDFINSSWKESLEEIIKQAFSDKYVLVSVLFIILLIILSILSSALWPIFRRSRIRLKRIKLLEEELDKRTQDSSSAPPSININTTNNHYHYHYNVIGGKIVDSKKSVYSKLTPDKPSDETKDYTGHATHIDSDKIELLDIPNDTSNPHNEDQE